MPDKPYRLIIPRGFAVVEWESATGRHFACARANGEGNYDIVTDIYDTRHMAVKALYRYLVEKNPSLAESEAV